MTHDLASAIVAELRRDDPLADMMEDPFVVEQTIPEGAMLRIVDVERALTKRPYLGGEYASATLRIEDATLPENGGTWRISGSGREMTAERTDANPDAEMSINAVAPLYSGYTSPATAAGCGLITLKNPDALPALTRLFAVDDIPYSPDWY
jgi:predicted acetyltransferase